MGGGGIEGSNFYKPVDGVNSNSSSGASNTGSTQKKSPSAWLEAGINVDESKENFGFPKDIKDMEKLMKSVSENDIGVTKDKTGSNVYSFAQKLDDDSVVVAQYEQSNQATYNSKTGDFTQHGQLKGIQKFTLSEMETKTLQASGEIKTEDSEVMVRESVMDKKDANGNTMSLENTPLNKAAEELFTGSNLSTSDPGNLTVVNKQKGKSFSDLGNEWTFNNLAAGGNSSYKFTPLDELKKQEEQK